MGASSDGLEQACEALIPILLYALLHDFIVSAKGLLLIYKSDETT